LRLIALIFWDFQPPWSQLLQFGYVSVDFDHLLELIAREWGRARQEILRQFSGATFPSGPQELCNLLIADQPSLRPFRPLPILRVDHNLAILDVAAGTAALSSAADFTTDQGGLANVRASHFERVVQGTIDETSWRPDSTFRRLRRRTLRDGGKAITDIDALGTKDGKLLLISAKSVIYTMDHDQARYRTIRNVASNVESACEKALKVEKRLRDDPKGDNFDFSLFSSIDVVVCIPFVPYLRPGVATATSSLGLMRAVALEELRLFLWGK
jgi:hypothetical protein